MQRIDAAELFAQEVKHFFGKACFDVFGKINGNSARVVVPTPLRIQHRTRAIDNRAMEMGVRCVERCRRNTVVRGSSGNSCAKLCLRRHGEKRAASGPLYKGSA